MCTSLLGDVGRRQRLDQVSQAEMLAALVQHEFMKLSQSNFLIGMEAVKYVHNL
jgi:predicted methyltransferase MtxX (methanogen marker protein 4)